MIVASAALVTLWFLDTGRAEWAFRLLWVTNALGFVFATVFTLSVDPSVARRSWRQAIYFPGLVLLLIVLCVNFLGDGLRDAFDPQAKH